MIAFPNETTATPTSDSLTGEKTASLHQDTEIPEEGKTPSAPVTVTVEPDTATLLSGKKLADNNITSAAGHMSSASPDKTQMSSGKPTVGKFKPSCRYAQGECVIDDPPYT
jgi:hypothetical protein